MTATVNASEVLKRYGIRGNSVVRAIQQVGEDIALSSDPLSFANSLISDLGGNDQYDLASARIVAKALVEQAMIQPIYDTDSATKTADKKLDKIKTTMPYVFAEPEVTKTTKEPKLTKSGSVRQSSRSNDKKPKAKIIFDANKDKTNGEIAQMIADDLQITYANAYYYVSRVFKR